MRPVFASIKCETDNCLYCTIGHALCDIPGSTRQARKIREILYIDRVTIKLRWIFLNDSIWRPIKLISLTLFKLNLIY